MLVTQTAQLHIPIHFVNRHCGTHLRKCFIHKMAKVPLYTSSLTHIRLFQCSHQLTGFCIINIYAQRQYCWWCAHCSVLNEIPWVCGNILIRNKYFRQNTQVSTCNGSAKRLYFINKKQLQISVGKCVYDTPSQISILFGNLRVDLSFGTSSTISNFHCGACSS